ncbi:MAG: zinc-binding dehydrogenase [Planctomycetes bacterium]|nr:zinc-binding dehydrogenase [Planctomycetota bacterium]
MKAAIVEKPGVLAIRDIPIPLVGPYDALCELLYGATCTGTDQHIIYGRFPFPLRYPTVLGHESIGRVVQVGPQVRNYRPGDLVTRVGTVGDPDGAFNVNWGGFAEFGLARDHWAMRQDGLPADRWTGCRVNQIIPAQFDPRSATMIITWRETLSFLTRMGVGAGAAILVMGSGGNGLAFAAHAVNIGASPVIVVGSAARRQAAINVGASHYLDYMAPNLAANLTAYCPDGFDFAIDAVGKSGQMDLVLPALKPDGTLCTYGIDEPGQCRINPDLARGSFNYFKGGYDEEETHQAVCDYFRTGRLDAKNWLDLDHPFDLADINDAFLAVRERKLIKALIRLHG